MMILQSSNDESTLQLGEKLARLLKPGMVIALHGDLGAGKTVLSRGIARGLQVTEAVTSPTFTVVQEYPLPDGNWLYHLDMYRINDTQSALAFGIDEFLYARNAVTLIEWPERIPELLRGSQQYTIELIHVDEFHRRLEFPDDFRDGLLAQGLPEGITLL